MPLFHRLPKSHRPLPRCCRISRRSCEVAGGVSLIADPWAAPGISAPPSCVAALEVCEHWPARGQSSQERKGQSASRASSNCQCSGHASREGLGRCTPAQVGTRVEFAFSPVHSASAPVALRQRVPVLAACVQPGVQDVRSGSRGRRKHPGRAVGRSDSESCVCHGAGVRLGSLPCWRGKSGR